MTASELTLSEVILGLNSPIEAPYQAGKDFSVLIACEDSTMAPSACEILELIEESLNLEGRLFYQWWNFEVLTISSLREMAAAEASTADMILLDLHQGRALPPEITEWVHQWQVLREDRPGALVVLTDSVTKKLDVSDEIILGLKQVAAAGHMNFIASRAMEVGQDTELARKVSEIVWQIRHGASKSCAKRIARRSSGTGGKRPGLECAQRR